MKANQFVEKILDNWPVKVVCFVMALFFYVFYQVSILDRKSFVVPLKVQAENGMVISSSCPSEVKVTVRSTPEAISSLRETDFQARLNLNYLNKAGEYNLPVEMEISDRALLAELLEIKVSPSEIKIFAEEKASVFVRVKPLTSGEVARGYEIKNIQVDPEYVEVTGPESLVSGLSKVQSRVLHVGNAKASFAQQVGVESPGAFFKVDEDEKVTMTVVVSPVITSRTFEKVGVSIANLSANLVTDDYITPLSIKVSGPLLKIENLKSDSITISANCSKILESGAFDVPLSISLPSECTVDEGLPETIILNFRPVEKPQVPDVERAVDNPEESASESSSPQEGDE